MKKVFTKGFFSVATMILFLSITFPVLAQFTKTTLETGGLYTALAKDASNNIYVTRVKAGTGGATYEVVKYTNGTGIPVSIYSTLTHELEDFPWGLAVASNGDVYISTDFTVGGGAIIRLNAASAYSPTTVQTGRYFTALTIDANNYLYAAEYNSGGPNYAVVKYTNPSVVNSAGTTLYSGITSTPGVSYPTGIAIAANGDIFVTDVFNVDGGLTYKGGIIKLTAPGYTKTNLSTDTYATAVYLDGAGDLYATENSGAGYKLNKYTGATGAPTAVYTPLHSNGIYYPYGVAAINTNHIFVADGDDGINGGEIMQLINIIAPTTQATNLNFSAISGYGATASWTNGNGSSRAVFIANVSAGSPLPVDGTPYTANTAFSSGTQIGATGWYCVYNGTGTSVNITNLSPGSTYRVMTVEYNGTGASSRYLTTAATNNPANVQTSILVDVNVSSTTSASTYTPGTNITQTITVSNFGPNAVTGENITNALLAGSTWTAVFGGGATGTANGIGGINVLVNLPLNGTVTYTAIVPIPNNQIGPLTLTTTVTAPVGVTDVNLANDQDNNVLQPPPISVTPTQTNVSCNGGNNGTATVAVSGGTPGYTYVWAPSGGTAATATGLAAGTYTVTITDATSATATQNFTITQPNALTATTSQTDVSCKGGSNGTASVTASGGTAAYTYLWAPSGGTAATATGLSAGTYTVTITDANLCTTTKTFTIAEPPIISATTAQTDVSCNGGSNGSASVVASGGTPGYTYVWSPSGGTGATATGLTAGTYTVTITDANSCTATKTFTIAEPQSITATTSQTNVSCNGGSNGTATVVVSGGTGAYTYAWAPSGGTSATASGLTAGTYTVTITDANTCTTTKSFTILEPPLLFAFASAQTNVSCRNGSNGSATVGVSGGTPGYTYLWSPSGGTAATATGLLAGTYSVTVTDANGCTATQSFVVTQPANVLSASAGAQTNISCNGGSNGSATVTVSGGTAGYTYSWSPSGGTAATATGLTAGTYTVTVTDANGCTATQSFTILQPPVLTANAGAQTNISCNGGANGSATVSASGGTPGYTYSWAPTGGTAATASGLTAGTYAVTVTDANGCTATQTFTILEPPVLSASAGAQTNVSCNGGTNGSATVSVSGGTAGYTYLWAPSGGTAATATGLSVGTYTVTVTDANGCTAIQNFTITEPPIVSIATASLPNGNVEAVYANTLSATGGSGSYSYMVTSGALPSGLILSSSGNLSGTPTGVGSFTFTVTATESGCNQTASKLYTVLINKGSQTITFSPLASATYGDALITLGGTASSGLTVSYNSSNTAVATISGNILTILSAGTTTITASQAGNVNFNAATQVGQAITVNQRVLVISATASNKVYDGNTAASVTLTDNRVIGDVFTVTADPATFANANVGIGKTVSVNNISIPAATAVNYTFNTSTTTTANITAKPITVIAVAKNKIYGDVDPPLTYTLSSPLIGADAFTGALSRDAGNNIGTYTIKQNTLALSNNYSLTYTSAIFTITAKNITGAFTASNKTYDGNTTANVSATSLTGVLPGDVTDVTLSGGTATFADANVGIAKVVTAAGMTLTGTKALNYNLTGIGTTTADITAKSITVTADAKSKVYGDADPPLTYTLSAPLVSGDSFTGTLSRAAGNNAGTYVINQNTLALSNNYMLTYQQANFVINKKPLTITADNKGKLQGAVNPTLTVSYSGFVNGEDNNVLTAQPVLSTTATTASPPGNYPITAALAAANNYAISYNDGVLNVVISVINAITLTPTPLYENNADNALAGTLGTTATDPVGTYTYTLVSGTGSADNAKFNISGNTVRATNSLNFETQSAYNIRVKTTSQYGVVFEQTFTISLIDVNEAPTLALINNQQICYTTVAQSVVLSGITAGPETAQNTTVSVSSNNAALFESLTVSGGVVSYKVKSGGSGTATVTVMVMDNGGTANGGVDTYSRTFTINVVSLPNAAITSDKGTSVSKGEIIKLTATGGVSYVWKADNSIMSGQNTAILTVRPAINTTYTVTATNSNGCSQTSDFTINVVADFAKIKITNLLTPNGDGFNDKWIVENIDLYPNNEVKIFDRAGRIVYAKKVYDNSWDGRLNGAPLKENTYYYIVDFGSNFKTLKGFITIVRE